MGNHQKYIPLEPDEFVVQIDNHAVLDQGRAFRFYALTSSGRIFWRTGDECWEEMPTREPERHE